MESGNIQL